MGRLPPRRKRTAKPEQGVHDVLAKIRAGVWPGAVHFRGDMVRIEGENRLVIVSRTKYEDFMTGAEEGVRINIKSFQAND